MKLAAPLYLSLIFFGLAACGKSENAAPPPATSESAASNKDKKDDGEIAEDGTQTAEKNADDEEDLGDADEGTGTDSGAGTGTGTGTGSSTTQAKPDLSGTWYMSGDQALPCSITGSSAAYLFTNEKGDASAGSQVDTTDGSVKVRATDWGNLEGNLVADLKRIEWANGTFWTRP